ncbi:MAG TPA: DUF1338 domain-containing protein [Bacteroidales bacterium]|nr:DUF1338 domain-containing protein [Bacteroidales bacterium]HSA42462.1 DUF1338 domain-containing protein [Bacteroidales bacterium]
MEAQVIFDRLWAGYTSQNPHVRKVYEAFTAHGESVVNDHIAFRTFDDPRIGVDVLARPFLASGYVEKGEYVFESKHLFAKHYEHPSMKDAPRVFISQLVSRDFSPFLQQTVQALVNAIPEGLLQSPELIYSGRQWGSLSYQVYQKLREESEYAAWLYVWGFCANHFTVSVNHLQKLSSLEQVNSFLKDHGFTLNDSGGEIKGTPAELLEQSSTMAGRQLISFVEGDYEVPACYYEFARRYPDTDGKLYSGFIAKSADKIFESTDNK